MSKPAPLLTRGYWCECWTQSPATGNASVQVGSIDVETATQAVRWIRVALRTIASALEPDSFNEAWDWLSGGYRDALQALAQAEPCVYTVHHGHTTIEWSARPVLFATLAHHRDINLPACTHQFTEAQCRTE